MTDLAPFEKRAALAEEQIALLAAKLEALEGVAGAPAAAPSGADQTFLLEVLREMQDLRVSMGRDAREADAVRQERDQLRAALKRAEEDREKAQYRCKHLLRSLEAAEKRAEKAA